MTEPSNEAVEKIARMRIRRKGKDWDSIDPGVREVTINSAKYDLEQVLPIERQRWEQEVRERLDAEIKDRYDAAFRAGASVVALTARRELGAELRQSIFSGRIFGEAEPVEGERGGELGRLDLGEGSSREEAEGEGRR